MLFNQSQSIIVYRNPLEKMLWEVDYFSILVPVFFGVIVFGIITSVGINIVNRFKLDYNEQNKWNTVVIVVAGVFGLFTIYKTII